MSRSRNIKPGFFRNEVLVDLPFEYRLLFIGIWTMADREGRLEDRPVKIKMELFPADNVDVDSGLKALYANGFIRRYIVGDSKFIQILSWAKHQNPHIKEAASCIPAPCENSSSTVQAQEIPKRAGLIPDSLNLIPDSLEKPLVRQAAQKTDEQFEVAWAAYPKRGGSNSKADALKAFTARFKEGESADVMIQGATKYSAHIASAGKLRTEFVMQAARFFGPGKHYLNDWTPVSAPQQTGPSSKAGQAIVSIEGLINGLDNSRDWQGFPEANLLVDGPPARK